MNILLAGTMKAIRGLNFYTFGKLKKLYRWVLGWADSRYGTWALFILAFIEASFFVIPPDVLLIALTLGKTKKWYKFALIATAGSVLGGFFGYIIGAGFFDTVGQRIIDALHYQDAFNSVGQLYKDNAFMAILGAAFTPIPYKVFTIAAGFWKVPLSSVFFGSLVGRAGRFFIIAGAIRIIGPKAKVYVDRYFNWISLGIFILAILGILAVKYLL